MIRPGSAARSAYLVATSIPQFLVTGYRNVEESRKERERHLATLAHRPTRRDLLAAHLCDLALALASPPVRVPARDALRKVIFDVVRGKRTPIGEDEAP